MKSLFCRIAGKIVMLSAVLIWLTAGAGFAEYNRTPESDIDPNTFRIDEKKFLGTRLNPEFIMKDESGSEFKMGDYLGKPLILVLSYFKCDGVCSIINMELKDLIEEVKRRWIGKDYSVLTLSFDKYETGETVGMFAKELALPAYMKKGWRFAVMKNPEEMKELTASIGYKYFWSPRDRTFFHPSVYVFISPQGRVTRYLYLNSIDSKDVDLALIEAAQNQIRPAEVIDMIVGFCYSYNFKEGKYTYNIPLFVAVGSLAVGITSFIVSVIVFKRRRDIKEKV